MSDFEIAAYDRNECLLCRKDGKVVGQVSVRDLRDESFGAWIIWNLLVFPTHRQNGVAEALVQCVLENFNDAPVLITAEPFHDLDGMTEEQLSAWYRRMGFITWANPLNTNGKWMMHEPSNPKELAED